MTSGIVRISPSILSADFTRLGSQLKDAEAAGADEIHFDVMDGDFVPSISFGFPLLAAARDATDLPIDVHMMVTEAARFAVEYSEIPGLTMTIHVEACEDPAVSLEMIRDAGMSPAISLNPATGLDAIEPFLPAVDRVLVMTVVPGAGGQAFMPEVLPKIEALRQLADATQPSLEIAVDGGIKAGTAADVARAGARTLISGSGVFSHPDGIAAGIAELRQAVAV
jgi:ribulose-phosphate 3-epimerase